MDCPSFQGCAQNSDSDQNQTTFQWVDQSHHNILYSQIINTQKTFYFEIITDSQELVKIVQSSPSSGTVSPSGTVT